MALLITHECVNCGACEDQCPNTAIRMGEDIFEIDHERCTECVGFDNRPTCVDACPVDCCVPDPLRIEDEETLFERALHLHASEAVPPRLLDLTSRFRA